ncbi:MAG: WecB/TagA/CpsF family glycosyltransferase [bacterium]|nr:WecB/TagA/CpsF family glycosyltransferase [bacterium]
MAFQTRDILGVNVHQISLDQLRKTCVDWFSSSSSHHIVTVNPEYVMAAQHDTTFATVLGNADIAIADGEGIVKASKYLYGAQGKLERITGTDFSWDLARLCAQYGKRMYLLGGRSDEVVQKAGLAFRRAYPELKIVGMRGGVSKQGSSEPYFAEFAKQEEMETILDEIRTSAPDVLLVAYGAPTQDIWIARYLKELPSIKIAIGVGGALDYVAGVVPRASRWMRALGLEWLFRLINQPIRRWRRIVTATIAFPHAVRKAKQK